MKAAVLSRPVLLVSRETGSPPLFPGKKEAFLPSTTGNRGGLRVSLPTLAVFVLKHFIAFDTLANTVFVQYLALVPLYQLPNFLKIYFSSSPLASLLLGPHCQNLSELNSDSWWDNCFSSPHDCPTLQYFRDLTLPSFFGALLLPEVSFCAQCKLLTCLSRHVNEQ